MVPAYSSQPRRVSMVNVYILNSTQALQKYANTSPTFSASLENAVYDHQPWLVSQCL